MSLLTVFTAPKPFTDPHIATIQRNAIGSWMHLGSDVRVLLVGEEAGMDQAAADYGVRILPSVKCNASGTPLVNSIFALAREASDSPYLAYVNADILLTNDLLQAVRQVSVGFKRSGHGNPQNKDISPFLLIGQRWDLDVTKSIDFTPGWDKRLQAETRTTGQLHPPAGSDYFVFPRNLFLDMPDFAIGRAGWDNWMIYHARQRGWHVIDGTPSIMAIHQNHDYSHLPGGQPHYDLEESRQNMKLAGGAAHMYMVLDTNMQLVDGEIRPAPLTPIRLIRAAERRVMPADGKLRGARGSLTRRLRRLRRRMA